MTWLVIAWLLLIALIVTWFAGVGLGMRKAREQEEKGKLLFVYIGPTEFIVAGTIVRLAPGDLFMARVWSRGDHNVGKNGGPIDFDPSSPTYDDPETFKPSVL
jgi:hypothetical protein